MPPLKETLESLRQRLSNFDELAGIERVFGSEHAVTQAFNSLREMLDTELRELAEIIETPENGEEITSAQQEQEQEEEEEEEEKEEEEEEREQKE